jgi:hypothetical protein
MVTLGWRARPKEHGRPEMEEVEAGRARAAPHWESCLARFNSWRLPRHVPRARRAAVREHPASRPRSRLSSGSSDNRSNRSGDHAPQRRAFLPGLFSVGDWARTCAIAAQPPFGGKLGFQINARVSKLEHRSTRPATVTARNPSETKSLLRMVHLPLRILVRIH